MILITSLEPPTTSAGKALGWLPSRRAKVAFAARTPLAVAHGGVVPAGGRRLVGDTVNLHGPRREGEFTADSTTAAGSTPDRSADVSAPATTL